MRGKAIFARYFSARSGITPAYAGKSLIHRQLSPFRLDHPRLCGEKYFSGGTVRNLAGSPPPMRGKVWETMKSIPSSRITPAYAGKRPHISSSLSQSRDHPRLCGEKLKSISSCQHTVGSPPPMRGKEFANGGRSKSVGITPAYAGKSLVFM